MQETRRNLQVTVTHHGDALEASSSLWPRCPLVCVFVCVFVHTLASCPSGRAAPLVAVMRRGPVWGCSAAPRGSPAALGH